MDWPLRVDAGVATSRRSLHMPCHWPHCFRLAIAQHHVTRIGVSTLAGRLVHNQEYKFQQPPTMFLGRCAACFSQLAETVTTVTTTTMRKKKLQETKSRGKRC